jgi:hypothetical protein
VGGRVATLVGLVAVAALIAAGRADAYIYWAVDQGGDGTTIARAENDGSSVNRNFITGLDGPCGVAVNAQHIYWGNRGTNTIGRANIDGTNANPTFINALSDTGLPCGPSLGGGKVWWANVAGGPSSQGSIGRANLDGTNPQPSFYPAPVASSPLSTAVGANSLVFWSNIDINGPNNPAIGRGGVDGVPAPVRNLIDFGSSSVAPFWLAADDQHVYTSFVFGLIAPAGIFRWDLNGSGPSQEEIAQFAADGGLAMHGGKLYFSNAREGTISRSDADGSNPELTIVTRAGVVNGIAVDGLSTPPGELIVGKLQRNKKRGTGQLTVTVNGAGTVGLEGEGLKPATAQAQGAGDVALSVKATGSKRKALKRKGKVKLTAEIGFVPTAGTPAGQTAKLKLVRK